MPAALLKLPKKPEDLQTLDEFRAFLDGPAADAAKEIVERCGVIGFRDQLETVLYNHEGPTPSNALDAVENTPHYRLVFDALTARTVNAYLVGLAVGRLIGGAR